MKPAEVLEVAIESLDQEGRGVGHREGKVVFVEGALPGESVHYERFRNKPSYESGRVVGIANGSVLRTTPRCPHFGLHRGACGGCSMQHIEPRAQVAIKQRVLEDSLWHIGRLRPECVLRPISGPPWGYRYRARFSVRNIAKKNSVLVGFHERASSYVADMDSCEVVPLRVSRLLVPLRRLVESLSLRDRLPQIELAAADRAEGLQIVLVLRVLRPPTAEDRELMATFSRREQVELWLQPGGPESAVPLTAEQPSELELTLPEFGISLPFRPTDFTQVNHTANAVLVSRALRLLRPLHTDKVVDFFCGLGNFTLPLATRAAVAHGVEGSEPMVARARAAAERNGLANRTTFEVRNLFEWSPADWERRVDASDGIDKVLVDPPREGALAIARVLAASANPPGRVVYVSCNPATLARDCAVLVHEGGWSLRAAGIVNLFPQTSHVESIAVLESARQNGSEPALEGSAEPSHAKISG